MTKMPLVFAGTGSSKVAGTGSHQLSYANSKSFPLSKADNSASESVEKTPVPLTDIKDQRDSTDVPGNVACF